MSTKKQVKEVAKIALPPGTRRFKAAQSTAQLLHIIKRIPKDAKFVQWVERSEPQIWSPFEKLSYEPKVSIVVPVYNPPPKYFLPMVYSVVNQSYQNWELILINASSEQSCRRQTKDCQHIDSRIKVTQIPKNLGIAANTKAGIHEATGDYIALLDHDDVLAPAAVYEMIRAIQATPDAGVIYSDEDKISANGEERFSPLLKPDWSPQLMRQVNFINHFSMVRRSIIDAIGGYRQGFEGAQDYDLYLRATDASDLVVHVPKILYHWRTTETSTAKNFSVKNNIHRAGIAALEDHLKRNGIAGSVTPLLKQPGFYKIEYKWDEKTDVAIVIMPPLPVLQRQKIVEHYINSTDANGHHVSFFASECTPKIAADKVTYLQASKPARLLRAAYEASSAKVFVVIGSGAVPSNKKWLQLLVGHVSQDKKVGVTGPMVLETDKKTILDSGLVRVGMNYINPLQGQPYNGHTLLGNNNWTRNVDSLSGKCMVMRREHINALADCYDGDELAVDRFADYFADKNLQICINAFSTFVGVGNNHLHPEQTKYFSPRLTPVRIDYELDQLANIPGVANDD